jgi:hypothetical protein
MQGDDDTKLVRRSGFAESHEPIEPAKKDAAYLTERPEMVSQNRASTDEFQSVFAAFDCSERILGVTDHCKQRLSQRDTLRAWQSLYCSTDFGCPMWQGGSADDPTSSIRRTALSGAGAFISFLK